MARLFTDTNDDGKNVLLLDYTSEWTIKGNPSMYVIGDTRIGGYEITGDAVDRFAELEKSAPHWISVKEQLPEEGEFIVTFNKYQNETFSFATFSRGTFNLFGLFSLSPYTVTHWYPLPAPPVD